MKPEHMVWMVSAFKTSRLSHKHFLLEITMEEDIMDIELSNVPLKGNNHGQHDPDGGRFDNRAKGFKVINPICFSVPLCDLSSLISIDFTIWFEFQVKYPFTPPQSSGQKEEEPKTTCHF